MKRQYYLLFIACFFLFNSCNKNITKKDSKTETEEELIERALKIHKKVLTLDTHADTPLRMIEPGFDMSERHDPNETGSKVDYPRMKEGDLDAIFFAAFVAQDIRNDDGNSRAKSLCFQMIDSILVSIERNSEIVGLALNPQDAYSLEKEDKRAIYIGIENGYPIGDDITMLKPIIIKEFAILHWCILQIMI
jgi:membrane dipeptidase